MYCYDYCTLSEFFPKRSDLPHAKHPTKVLFTNTQTPYAFPTYNHPSVVH